VSPNHDNTPCPRDDAQAARVDRALLREPAYGAAAERCNRLAKLGERVLAVMPDGTFGVNDGMVFTHLVRQQAMELGLLPTEVKP
jgi:hypothetical protein